jgi:PAS domain S-box-containing protein
MTFRRFSGTPHTCLEVQLKRLQTEKKFNEALKESEKRSRDLLGGLLDSMPDIVFFKGLDGVYLGCNQRFADYLGRSREKIIGCTDYDFVPKETADSFRENDRLMLESGTPRHNEEWIHYSDGGSRLVDTLKAPLRSSDGECIGVIGISRDITARHETEQRLRESEENFRTFFETLNDLIVVATPEGLITFTNSAVQKKLGFSPEDIRQMHVLDLHPPDKRHEAEKIFAEMFAGERDSCPLPLRTVSGERIPVETRVWFGKWSGSDCIFGICKDLRKEQEALQKFNRLFSSNPALMSVCSLPDLKFTDVNHSFLRTLGYSREEVVGKTSQELMLFAEPEKHTWVAEEIQNIGRIRNLELKARKKDGTILDGLFSGEVIDNQGHKSFITVMVDVTDRKRAEQTVRMR